MISFKGRVAIITGAGRGLGRAYALAFAQRGAHVLVNDLGTGVDGRGTSPLVAEEVVALIRAQGGWAVANCEDVSTAEGGAAIARQALESFGRIDILVNNAGICVDRPFGETTLSDFEFFWRSHVGGHINLIHAVWPAMTAQKYGRIIATGSGAGLFGLRNQSAYSAAKGAIHGLMKTLALEGADHGILVNAVCPGGFSRMHEAAFSDPQVLNMMREAMPAELVAPMVLWLASDACNVKGQEFSVWGGRVARVVLGTGAGYSDRELTPETVDGNRERICSTDQLFEPADGVEDVVHWQHRLAPGP